MSDATLFSVPKPAARPAPEPLPETRNVDVAALPTLHALTRQTGRIAHWFDWTANPYRGCEFACGYCYARGTHEWLGHKDPRAFQETIYVKEGFVEALRRDLRTRVKPGEHIAIGTATDPYQPIERRECVMRGVLRELARASGLSVSITTKSNLVARDIDLIRAVARRNTFRVHVTVTTADARLARFLEPRAPAPSSRLEAVRALRAAGIRVGVNVMPVMPGINDGENELRALLGAAREAGADYAGAQTVFLSGPARDWFLARLRRDYPRVAARYELWTRTRSGLPREVQEEVAARFRKVAREVGISLRSPRDPREEPEVQRMFEFAG